MMSAASVETNGTVRRAGCYVIVLDAKTQFAVNAHLRYVYQLVNYSTVQCVQDHWHQLQQPPEGQLQRPLLLALH